MSNISMNKDAHKVAPVMQAIFFPKWYTPEIIGPARFDGLDHFCSRLKKYS